jgi:eukaryotic-like serine/threonine-protein kinase
MAYPNIEDYVRAVQQPGEVFQIGPLRRAAFELHPVFRIPMPASGSAAVVFKASVDGVDTALRFFIQDDVSSRERYTALARHFAGHGLADCVASAAWVDHAIAIHGATWPVVQMEWIEGRSLDAYVAHLARRNDVGALACLAHIWRGFIARLQDAEFAHGDLQHGNVIVDRNGSLRLVDFDGSWIAAFRGGAPPRETGHLNYQRTGRTWGRWMDTFPGLVIYTALLGLSRRPDSWEALHNGENMLFSHNDFAPPFRTPTWELLSSIRDDEVVHAVTRLKQACEPRWQADKSLELLLRPRPSGPSQVPRPSSVYPGVGRMIDHWWDPRMAGVGYVTTAPDDTQARDAHGVFADPAAEERPAYPWWAGVRRGFSHRLVPTASAAARPAYPTGAEHRARPCHTDPRGPVHRLGGDARRVGRLGERRYRPRGIGRPQRVWVDRRADRLRRLAARAHAAPENVRYGGGVRARRSRHTDLADRGQDAPARARSS